VILVVVTAPAAMEIMPVQTHGPPLGITRPVLRSPASSATASGHVPGDVGTARSTASRRGA
jgi:hypothetical protein